MQKTIGPLRPERYGRLSHGFPAPSHVVTPAVLKSRFRCPGLLAGAVLGCLLTGCVVGPKYHAPVTQAPTAFKETPPPTPAAGEWTIAQPQDAKLRGNWWEIFNDNELNDLEGQLNI